MGFIMKDFDLSNNLPLKYFTSKGSNQSCEKMEFYRQNNLSQVFLLFIRLEISSIVSYSFILKTFMHAYVVIHNE